MRLLADENFPGPVVHQLRAAGHDVLWARTDCPGWSDTALLDRAEAESRVVLTLDKDFWQISVQRRAAVEKSGVILFRVHPATAEKLAPLARLLDDHAHSWARHVSIISIEGIQMVAIRTR